MQRFVLPLLLLVGVGGIVLVYAFDPHQSALFPPCPFKVLTGWNCPGCGSTRAMHLLLHGQIVAALGRNPLMVLSIPLLLLMAIRPTITRKPWVAWSTAVILLTYGILRNLPVRPFSDLAP